MIVADSGAVYALLDAADRHHARLRRAFEEDPRSWVIPWAVLPEVDYLVTERLGREVADAFRQDLVDGLFTVEWGGSQDLVRALELDRRHADLDLGLVDAVVMAVAERLGARAIATLDLRDFAPVALRNEPELWPRDLRA